jgi:hypothetical protein
MSRTAPLRSVCISLSLITLAALPASSIGADTVELSGGGHLTGKVQRKADYVIVTVDDDIQVAIQNSRVRRVVTSDQLKRYREMAARIGDDAERHYQMSRWCMADGNVPGDPQQYRQYHLRRAIEIDPEHVHARAALNYVKHKGDWVLTAKLMRDRGMIMQAGHWEPAESVAIEEVHEANNVESKKWIREVNRLTAVVVRNSSKSAEALQTIKAIRDPMAAEAIAKQLRNSREKGGQSRALRLVWINLLGQFRNSVAVEALVRAGIDENDQTMREAALNQLQQYGASSASATYLPMLKSNNNKLVNRAARALSWFPDPELALTYVDALVTTHQKESAPGPGMQVGFGTGGGGMQMGGKKTVERQSLTNPAVLSLVKTIEPEVDYGYDEAAWRRHFANKKTQFSGDLRRDP